MTALSLSLIACSPEKDDTNSVEISGVSADKHSGIIVENIDPEVRPGNDFNAYVNGGWMDNAEIAADRASNSVGLEVHERSQANVKIIIEESAAGDFAKGSDEQKVGDLYASYLDMETRNKLGASPLIPEFERIDALKDYGELAIYFAEATKLGVSVPFALGQYVDFKDPNTYMMYIEQAGIGLPDREFYFEEGEKQEDIRRAYVAHIETMFELAGLPDGATSAKMIMELESRMAAEHMKKELTRDMVLIYNKLPLSELPDLMPNFAWDAYLTESGIADIDGLVVMMLDYMRALDGIIVDTSMEDWKTFLKWAVLNQNASLLNDGRQYNF